MNDVPIPTFDRTALLLNVIRATVTDDADDLEEGEVPTVAVNWEVQSDSKATLDITFEGVPYRITIEGGPHGA